MYQLLFNIRYQHEYFDHNPLFNMECAWAEEMERLIKNMGLLVVPGNGEISILFDHSRFDRQTFLDTWSDETLVVYLTPKESRIFFNVTKGIKKLVRAESSGEEKHSKKTKYFRFYQYRVSNTAAMDGEDFPIEALDRIKSLEDFGVLGEVLAAKSVSEAKDVSYKEKIEPQPSSGVMTIKKIAAQKALFVVAIKIEELLKAVDENIENPSLTLQFKAVEAHYKYYFTAMSPDEHLQVLTDDDDQENVTYQALENEFFGNRSIAAFISNKPLALRWQHNNYFKLVRNVKNMSQTLIEKLPHPDPTRFFKHKEPDKDPIRVLESFIN